MRMAGIVKHNMSAFFAALRADGWGPTTEGATSIRQLAAAHGIPVAAGFRRQDAIANDCPVWAGNLGYGPNPKLTDRIKSADLILAVGARLG